MSLTFFGDHEWPASRFWPVAVSTVLMGLIFTTYSEWMNVEVRHSWAYTDLMPRLPPLGTGLSPLLQWLVLPVLAFAVMRRINVGKTQ